jgi:hypothetical protein
MEDQDAINIDETRATTVGELMHMIDALNAAFMEKLGKEPAGGFNVEIKTVWDNRVIICGGYESFSNGYGAVVNSTDYMGDTPKEAFEYAMNKIEEYYVPTKEERIKALQDELDELSND